MEVIKFAVQKREVTGKELAEIRAKGLIPGVVYGPEIKENLLIQVRQVDADKLYRSAGESSVISLEIEGGDTMDVLIKDVARNPLTLGVAHIDFYKLKAGEQIETKVKLEFVGESVLIKAGGTLVVSCNEIGVRCLPKDLVGEIKIDLTALKEFGDTIYIKDLSIPEGIEILENVDNAVASISAPAAVEVFEKPVEAMPEVAGEKKAEGADKKEDKK